MFAFQTSGSMLIGYLMDLADPARMLQSRLDLKRQASTGLPHEPCLPNLPRFAARPDRGSEAP